MRGNANLRTSVVLFSLAALLLACVRDGGGARTHNGGGGTPPTDGGGGGTPPTGYGDFTGGPEFQVSTWTTGGQDNPSVASLPDGGFVVVWQSYGQDGSVKGVYGQRYDSDGDKVGTEFQVNTWTTGDQEAPSITSLPNGGFVVVWESLGQDGSEWGVYGQRFDSNGNKVGSEFQVNTWTTGDQQAPSITSLPDGGFVVVWYGDEQDGRCWDIYGQRFDSNGNKIRSEFRVNTWTTDCQLTPSITSLSYGGFVVVWISAGQDGDRYGVFGRMFDSNGNKVGSEFQVNTWTTGHQQAPSISWLPNGGFVVVWQSDNGLDEDVSSVYGQRFDSSGSKVGSEFQVNTWTTHVQWNPSITSLFDGEFVVVWQSRYQDGSGEGVYGQRFDSSGNKVGSEFQVNIWTTGHQMHPSITSLPNGGFVVVWTSGCSFDCEGQDGPFYRVYGRVFRQ